MARRRPKPREVHLETCRVCGKDSYLLDDDGLCPACQIERDERAGK